MTLTDLKEMVRRSIAGARTEKAIEEIIKWARNHQKEQLKDEVSLLKGKLTELNREKRVGILSSSEADRKQSKINLSVLNLLDSVKEDISVKDISITIGGATPSPQGKIKILMLTANPAYTTKLNLVGEHSSITQKLQRKQELFYFILKKAVSSTEFKEFTQQEKPDILHFSGHGKKGDYAGIVVQNDDKNAEDLISTSALDVLFEFFKKQLKIKVVLLNACYSQEQASAISKYVEYVIGTNIDIEDIAAKAFSTGFYFQLAEANKMNIENAFASGRTEAVLKGAEKRDFVIYRKGRLIEV